MVKVSLKSKKTKTRRFKIEIVARYMLKIINSTIIIIEFFRYQVKINFIFGCKLKYIV